MKKLRSMLKDTKNHDFKDRIYYAMADVSLSEGNEEEGVKYLRRSVAASTNNNIQKVKPPTYFSATATISSAKHTTTPPS